MRTEPRTKLRAFTLVEVILVSVILGIMAVGASSAILNYHRTSVMDAELRTITARLQRARQLAIGNPTGQDYSVRFMASQYVMFPGTTYVNGGANNQVFSMDTNVLVSSTYTNNQVSFSNFTGRTNVAGSITLSAFGMNRTIVINSLGIVEDIV